MLSTSVSTSPSLDSLSESSLPSVSSSFFFSESPRSGNHSLHDLIIPSLSLPPPLNQPTPFGQTLGLLRLLILGPQGAKKSFLTGLLLEDNEDVVQVGAWEDWEDAKVLKASTDWLELNDAERYEPTRNVHIVELPGYSDDADPTELANHFKSMIQGPFHALHALLHPDTSPSAMVSSLLASSSSPLYTALVFLLPSAPTPLDLHIISDLSTHIPLIVLPRLFGPHREPQPEVPSTLLLSAFRPSSAVALRNGLFHSPETLATLRTEAVDRFLRWREVEKSVESILGGAGGEHSAAVHPRKKSGDPAFMTTTSTWDKARWEADWLANFSRDVDSARRKREATITQQDVVALHPKDEDRDAHARPIEKSQAGDRPRHSPATVFDPLHLPSLLVFSVSLLGPLRARLGYALQEIWESLNETQVKLALLGGFCMGFGVGVSFYARR